MVRICRNKLDGYTPSENLSISYFSKFFFPLPCVGPCSCQSAVVASSCLSCTMVMAYFDPSQLPQIWSHTTGAAHYPSSPTRDHDEERLHDQHDEELVQCDECNVLDGDHHFTCSLAKPKKLCARCRSEKHTEENCHFSPCHFPAYSPCSYCGGGLGACPHSLTSCESCGVVGHLTSACPRRAPLPPRTPTSPPKLMSVM